MAIQSLVLLMKQAATEQALTRNDELQRLYVPKA